MKVEAPREPGGTSGAGSADGRGDGGCSRSDGPPAGRRSGAPQAREHGHHHRHARVASHGAASAAPSGRKLGAHRDARERAHPCNRSDGAGVGGARCCLSKRASRGRDSRAAPPAAEAVGAAVRVRRHRQGVRGPAAGGKGSGGSAIPRDAAWNGGHDRHSARAQGVAHRPFNFAGDRWAHTARGDRQAQPQAAVGAWLQRHTDAERGCAATAAAAAEGRAAER